MTAFAYNNNVHANTNKTSHELLKNYIANIINEFEKKLLKKETSLITEQTQ